MMENIKDYLQSRPPRERYILIGGTAVTVVFILYWLVAGMTSSGPSRQGGLDRVLADQKEFHKVLAEYKTLANQVQEFDNRLKSTQEDLDLFATLNSFADQSGIKEQIIKMDPSDGAGTEYYDEWYVDMNLQKIPLEPLTKFMKKIDESSSFLRITRITIKRRFDQSETLDVNLRVNAYRAKQGT